MKLHGSVVSEIADLVVANHNEKALPQLLNLIATGKGKSSASRMYRLREDVLGPVKAPRGEGLRSDQSEPRMQGGRGPNICIGKYELGSLVHVNLHFAC